MSQSSSMKSTNKAESESSLRKILKDSLSVLKSACLPLILFVILLSLLSSIIITFTLTDFFWEQKTLAPIITEINTKLDADPNYQLSAEEREFQIRVVYLFIATNVFNYVYQFIPIIGLFLITPAKLYYIHTKAPENKISWIQSLLSPFRGIKRAISAIFLFLFFIIIIPVGLMIFYIPGIIFMVYGFFSFYSLILDEKVGLEVLRGGIFYTKDQFPKIMAILMLGMFLPMLITLYTIQPLMDLFGFSISNFESWIDPANRNYPMIFIFEFLDVFLLNILFIWLPVVYTVAFDYIRREKLTKIEEMKTKLHNNINSKVNTIELQPDQVSYYCPNCNQKLPISARKCPRCHRLYRIIIKK